MNRSVPPSRETTGEFVTLDGDTYYRISAYDRMPPFLMSVVSDTDLWMFVASSGGLTAGRADADGGLFPYETVDRLYDGHHHTGPITLIRVTDPSGEEVVWEPFSKGPGRGFDVIRNLYKNTTGNQVVFEEINPQLHLAFRYRWSGSDSLGLVRTATLSNHGTKRVEVSVLDGLRNVLPFGAPLPLYQQLSCLVDAYKRADCDPDTGLCTFSLTSRIVDRPVAAEVLRANAVWCHGLDDFDVALSPEALAEFRRGEAVTREAVLTGRRGNYLVASSFDLDGGAHKKWHLVADAARSHAQLAATGARLREGRDLDLDIEESLSSATEDLRRIVGQADGLQLTGRAETAVHHFANVLFNSMRGGVFTHHYDVPTDDFLDFLGARNRPVAHRHAAMLENLPPGVTITELVHTAEQTTDADLRRLAHEYLPLYFGRRHGDPSRPWNRFSIRVRNPDGSRALWYEGNWRDIFQNWEALSASFPRFLPGIVAKFVNASTVDGFNPYRITRDGIDWEVAHPDDPWSHIGYWGDHQIVYLLKFLEALQRYAPGALEDMLHRRIFCYANVPYRLKPYEQIVDDPRATIVYDAELALRIDERVRAIGADGKLVTGGDRSVYHVNLLEKLLVPALSKLSNFVAGGGVWMNTQRPEWNDANNALVGNGVSMVTLCYLRRYLRFLERLLEGSGGSTAPISAEVASWLRNTSAIYNNALPILESGEFGDGDRRQLLDRLGQAFEKYRERVYAKGFSGTKQVPIVKIVALCRDALRHVDHTILANRRADGLYHSYNLLEVSKDTQRVSVSPLYEMLEGQVAALSSGVVGAVEAAQLIERLFESRLYRDDQRSFMLYPERELPAFMKKNAVPEDAANAVPLLRELLRSGDRSIVERDALGVIRFQGDFRNAHDLSSALDRLAADGRWAETATRDRQAVLDVFELVFDHCSYTGRSGTMYGYEGLGCIYWHMVAKLLLAVQEIVLRAESEGQPAKVQDALKDGYYRIRSGLGFEKTVLEYGAFPTDPYSHTPRHAGAQQPGMTGQVKEEILTRFGELGVVVNDGIVRFQPALLRRSEFMGEAGVFQCYDAGGNARAIDVRAGELAFTFCQVPVIYHICEDGAWIRVTRSDGRAAEQPGNQLDDGRSRELFDRLGTIERIDVGVPEDSLYRG